MRNLALCWPNRFTEATVSQGSYESLFPPSNLYDPEPTAVARTTDLLTTSTWLRVTFPTPRTIRSIAPMNTNATRDCTFRVKAGTTAGASDLLDTGVLDLWRIPFDTWGIEWRSTGNWWDDAQISTIYGAPWTPGLFLNEDVTSKYWDLFFDDTANPDGYLQFGRLFMGPALILEHGAEYGGRRPLKDFSSKAVLLNGGIVRRARRAARKEIFNLPLIWNGPEEYRVQEMLRVSRTVNEVYYVPKFWDPAVLQYKGFVGTLDELSGMSAATFRSQGMQLQITESI